MRPEHWLYTIPLRLRSLFRRAQADQELDDELRDHLERKTEEYVAQGMAQGEAHRRARLDLGGIEQTKEKCRDARRANWIQDFVHDLRFGLRMLRKAPGFTAVAVITLALGISANTTIFSTVNAFFLRKPPIRDPDRVVIVSSVSPEKNTYAPDRIPVSAPDYLDWRAQDKSFDGMAAADFEDFTISGGTAPERVAGARVSSNFFEVLGVGPAMGRTFLPEENQWGRDHSVILSDELWKGRFGGDPRVLGHLVKINGQNHTVAGVMPRPFRLWDFEARLWIPLTFSPDDLRPPSRSTRLLRVFARLKPGTDERKATAEMQTITQRIAEAHKDTNKGWGASVMSLQRYSIADSNSETATAFLMAAVGFVLLIACTNLANLMLARNSIRQREFIIRSALGAGRFRLARQLFTECLLLSIAGGGLGILGAFWGVRLLRSQFNWNEGALEMAKEISVDSRVLIFTLAISLGAGILFGLAPAIQIVRQDASDGLQEGGRGGTAAPRRLRLQRLANLPGVQSAAGATDLPYNFPGYVPFTVEGHPVTKPDDQPKSGWFTVSPGHFATLQVPLLQGREFTSSDTADASPVVIVNEAFARRFFGGENPVGRHIRLDLGDRNQNRWSEVVGVVGNVMEFLGQVQPRPQIFVPFAAHPSQLMRFIVRTRTDPLSLSDSLRHAVWAVDPDQAVTEIRTMDRVIRDSGAGDDAMAQTMGVFALLGLLMAAVGIFGVVSYLVEQRTQEMGIRLALGAEPAGVLRLMIRKGMALVGVGTGIGILVSLGLPKLAAAEFENFHFHSIWVLIFAPVVVVLTGFAACYLPARRAMRVDPMVALRYE